MIIRIILVEVSVCVWHQFAMIRKWLLLRLTMIHVHKGSHRCVRAADVVVTTFRVGHNIHNTGTRLRFYMRSMRLLDWNKVLKWYLHWVQRLVLIWWFQVNSLGKYSIAVFGLCLSVIFGDFLSRLPNTWSRKVLSIRRNWNFSNQILISIGLLGLQWPR